MANKLSKLLRGNRSTSPARPYGHADQTPPVRAMYVPPATDLAADEQQLADDMRSLSAHLELMNECRAKIATARAPVERLTEALEDAKRVVTNAVAALAQLDAHEQERIEAWAQNGAGERPVPSVQRRLELERAVTDANRSVANVESALATKRALLAPLQDELTTLSIRRDALVVNVLCGRAEIIGHHYRAALENLVRLGGELRGLNMCLAQMFSHVTLRRPDAPLYASVLQPPALCRGKKEPLYAEVRLMAEGFYLHAHNYRDIEAVATADDVVAAAGCWRTYAMALMGVDAAGNDQDAAQLARLVAQNAKLRQRLTGNGLPKNATGDVQCK